MLSFELLMSGPAEEILFRGFFQSFLRKFWPEIWHLGKVDLPVAGLITALIFSLVHINYTLSPFAIIIWMLDSCLPLSALESFTQRYTTRPAVCFVPY
jgi:membrane protease YdiL (CAAX protease family)